MIVIRSCSEITTHLEEFPKAREQQGTARAVRMRHNGNFHKPLQKASKDALSFDVKKIVTEAHCEKLQKKEEKRGGVGGVEKQR